jgi:hypothetical protein
MLNQELRPVISHGIITYVCKYFISEVFVRLTILLDSSAINDMVFCYSNHA